MLSNWEEALQGLQDRNWRSRSRGFGNKRKLAVATMEDVMAAPAPLNCDACLDYKIPPADDEVEQLATIAQLLCVPA